VRPGYTEPAAGLVAVDVRGERSHDVIVRLRDALVYIDGERVTGLMNGENVVFYLGPGVHRIGVSTQFDPVVELGFLVTADPC
jgi:phage gp45-like